MKTILTTTIGDLIGYLIIGAAYILMIGVPILGVIALIGAGQWLVLTLLAIPALITTTYILTNLN